VKSQKYKHGRQLKVKINILFYGETHKPLHLDKWNLVQYRIMDMSSIWITNFIDKAFIYGNSAKSWGYIGTNAEALCAEFCNFVQCHTL
jgi:hypothetical protein